MKNIHLVLIDCQTDFCDPNGALYVKGAEKDMERLGTMIKRCKREITDIHATLDSHHPVHVAHPIFWTDSKGNHPAPFTLITADDVRNGKWSATRPHFVKWSLNYVESLEKNGRYVLCIWPPHCLIGTPGHTVFAPIRDALTEWTDQFAIVDYVTKGSSMSEHYSVVQADVPDPDIPETQMNVKFIETVNEADLVLLAGEAGSHCLCNSGRDIANFFQDDSFVKKLVFLEDASSPVPGFEHLQQEFVKDMTARGMQVTTTTDFMV